MSASSVTPRAARLGLGTVQFGIKYGITNASGQTSREEVKRILENAQALGLRILDTATLYGESEATLGGVKESEPFAIVTKTPALGRSSATASDVQAWRSAFDASLDKLARRSVYGLLVHHAHDVLVEGGEQLVSFLRDARDRGLVEKIGVSSYSPSEVDAVLARYPDLSLIQVPVSVFDQRFLTSGCIDRARKLGVEVHSRSAYLQGVLGMEPEQLPVALAGARENLRRFREQAAHDGVSPLRAALSFALGQPSIDCCVIGVTSLTELMDVVPVLDATQAFDTKPYEAFALTDEAIILPSRWT